MKFSVPILARSRRCPRAVLAIAVLAGGWLGGAAHAQTTARGRPCDGQNGFVVRDAQTGQIVAQGWTTPDGTLGDGLILGANRTFSITVANGLNNLIGTVIFNTRANGTTTTIPPIQSGTSIDRDSDGDGVTDEIERVFGTDPRNPSTFGGGISDRVIATTPPPPGTPVGGGIPLISQNPAFGPPGIAASVALPGEAVDVSAFNDLVAVATGEEGVAIFNIFGGASPRQIASIDTAGNALSVGLPQTFLPVADGPGGLAIIDLSDPARARIHAQLSLGFARSVASMGNLAIVGMQSGNLVIVDQPSATEVQRLPLGAEVYDVAVSGDFIWALRGNELRSFSDADGIFTQRGRVVLSSLGPDPYSGRKRLFAGGGLAYASTSQGFDVVDISNPANPVRIGASANTGPGSFKQIVVNGSGVGVAAVGVNPRADGTHHLSIFNVRTPANTTDLLTILSTPGTAYANTIYQGLSYVADGDRGLQVMRYLETDRAGIPPMVRLRSSANNGVFEEGKLFRLAAEATDDVQVRNVEFFLDGQLVATDGNFPFEVFFTSPLMSGAKSSFTARARAFDTGGNSTWSDSLEINLVRDITPPRVTRLEPPASSIAGSVQSVAAYFSEPMQPTSFGPGSFTILHAGGDGLFGTADDQVLSPETRIYDETLRAAVRRFASAPPPGRYRATVQQAVTDSAGNALRAPVSWTFFIFDQPDRDGDGVPDALEALLGLNPDNPDSRGDGIRDGDRDFDNDRLSNSWEVLWGYDPRNARSRVPNVLDGDLDPDGDGLLNRFEQVIGSNPGLADSDGDGWNDEAEYSGGSDPLDPASRPKLWTLAQPLVRIALPHHTQAGTFGRAVTVARPPVSVLAPGFTGAELRFSTVLARPPVAIGLAGFAGLSGAERPIVLARPPVSILAPAHSAGDLPFGVFLAKPPIKVETR